MTIEFPPALADAIRSRRSIRRFLPDPVPKATLEALLDLAARAPSGTNVQPWKVYALAGEARSALSEAILKDYYAGRKAEREFDYYPKEWCDPWLARRRKVGLGLYQLLGIEKGDKARMHEQTARNYQFFDAPVGLVLTLNRKLGRGMFLDYGIFIGNFIAAARSLGFDTCVQAAFADYPDTVRAALSIAEDEIIVCGIALGRADPDAPENALETERVPAAEFTEFRGF